MLLKNIHLIFEELIFEGTVVLDRKYFLKIPLSILFHESTFKGLLIRRRVIFEKLYQFFYSLRIYLFIFIPGCPVPFVLFEKNLLALKKYIKLRFEFIGPRKNP